MMRKGLIVCLLLAALTLLAACGGGGSSDADPAARAVEAYLTAKVGGDADAIRAGLCSEMEAVLERELHTFDTVSGAQIEDIYLTNLSSTVRFVKQAVPLLEASGGNVVIVSSTASRFVVSPSQLLSVYGASKAGLNQFTRAVAPELGPKGIRINAVAPGLTRGEYADEGLSANDVATQDWIRSVTPLGRIGEPDDIARVIAFMASDMASWVTGQVIDASGGWQIAGG